MKFGLFYGKILQLVDVKTKHDGSELKRSDWDLIKNSDQQELLLELVTKIDGDLRNGKQ